MSGKSLFRSGTPAPRTPRKTSRGVSRSLMIEHYEQHLRTSNSRNGRPYAPETINGYLRCVRYLAAWLDAQGTPGDLTPACDPQVFNAFLRDYLTGHDLNGTSFVQRNLRNLFKWLEKETGTASPFTSEDTDRYVAREHKPQTLAREFIHGLLCSCDSATFTGVRDEAIIRLLLEGPRVGEVADMQPDDVPSLTEPILRVTPAKGELRYADGSGRRILLEQETVKALQRYLRVRAEHPLADSHLAGHLWLGQGSALPFGANGIRLMLIRRCKRLGYDAHATPKMFRHTFAHDFRAHGGSIDDLVHHQGWAGPAMAYRYGKDLAEDRAIQAKRKLGNMY